MGEWDAWIGRSEQHGDRVDAGLVARWCATLDREGPVDGSAPLGLHWCLAPPQALTMQLGSDGHPQRDSAEHALLPPVPLPRRMWAAGTLQFHGPLPVGAGVVRTSRVIAVTAKTGTSGPLVFVEIAHDLARHDHVLVSETQSLVYRAAAPPGAALVPTPAPGHFDPAPWLLTRTVRPGPALLFRYSALTFNSHRIHYDWPYATQAEGYRGLVVQGPLIASLLIDLARRHLGGDRLASFRFRGASPAIADEPLHLVLRETADGLDLAAFADDGRQVMAATAQVMPATGG
ncbi:MaoC family dehydratase N-terminal domain-containing protein [Novosphingobium sp.]|uniref:FAS1-like dehydratase domain-containing protein n=1 Tax=Novosphingobium sp. TaxID=1874826 RepID=UPI003341BFE1